jgi:hypothetical protein
LGVDYTFQLGGGQGGLCCASAGFAIKVITNVTIANAIDENGAISDFILIVYWQCLKFCTYGTNNE